VKIRLAPKSRYPREAASTVQFSRGSPWNTAVSMASIGPGKRSARRPRTVRRAPRMNAQATADDPGISQNAGPGGTA
jgi:hypothetical protein